MLYKVEKIMVCENVELCRGANIQYPEYSAVIMVLDQLHNDQEYPRLT